MFVLCNLPSTQTFIYTIYTLVAPKVHETLTVKKVASLGEPQILEKDFDDKLLYCSKIIKFFRAFVQLSVLDIFFCNISLQGILGCFSWSISDTFEIKQLWTADVLACIYDWKFSHCYFLSDFFDALCDNY